EAKQRLAGYVPPVPEGHEFPFTRVYVLSGMKIGGLPFISDYDDPSYKAIGGQRLLCSLSDIVPLDGVRYPWLNHPEPIPFFIGTGPGQTLDWESNEHSLVWYDGFDVNFFCDKHGCVRWYYQL